MFFDTSLGIFVSRWFSKSYTDYHHGWGARGARASAGYSVRGSQNFPKNQGPGALFM
jgi:hypothetical protein